jgi:hypothetical protein
MLALACSPGEREEAGASSVAWELAAEPTLVIGALGSESAFHFIGAAARLADGRIVVADGFLSPRLSLFAPTGEPLDSIGRQGDGLGEHAVIGSVQAGPDDSLFVYDRGHQRLSVFTNDGRLVRSVSFAVTDGVTGSDGLESVTRLEDGVWVGAGQQSLKRAAPGTIERDTIAVGLLDGVLEGFRPLERLPAMMTTTTSVGGRNAFGPPSFSPRVVHATWGRCVFVSSAETPRIVVYASDGTRVTEFDGPGTLRPVSPQHLDARLEWAVERANEGHEEATRRIYENAVHTDHLPYYHALVVDPWGHVWLQEYEPPWGPGPRWYVLSQAGEHLADVVMPEELTVHAISEDGHPGRNRRRIRRRAHRGAALDHEAVTRGEPPAPMRSFLMPRLRFALHLALLAPVSCGGPDQNPASDPDAPLAFTPSDVHVLGTSEAIAEVRDLAVLADGSVWVLNSLAPFFVGFDAEGGVLGAHGTAGGGPEEFQLPSAFVTGGTGDAAWVFDFRRHALIEISDPGAPWSQISIPRDAVPGGSLVGGMDIMSSTVRTARLGDEIVLARTSGSMDQGIHAFRMSVLAADLLALDPATESVRTVVTLGDVLRSPAEGFDPVAGGFPLWYRLWTVCGDTHLRVYDRVGNQIRSFAADGAEGAPTALPPVPFTEVSERQFARALFPLLQAEATGAVGRELTPEDSVRLLNDMVQRVEGEPDQLAAYLPRYVDFRCGADGDLWMQPFDLERGGLAGSSTWLRIAPDGTTGEVRMPDRFDAFRFTADRIWGVQRDGLDRASVAWIELPGGAAAGSRSP